MKYTTLITLETLSQHFSDPNWVIVDCHYLLDDPEAGRRAYRRGHIPGAIYAHLDEDLSGEIIPGKTGRHPLPEIETFSETLSGWGIGTETQVIVYDNRGGVIAVRLWWMLKWLGHEAVAVLDGSFNHWKKAGLPVTDETPNPLPKRFVPRVNPKMVATLEEVETIQQNTEMLLVDSRAPERFRGETEPLDAVAGHIPGAVNYFFMDNLDENGKLRQNSDLKKAFTNLIGDTPPENVIFYCGSGVTSAHNILAMLHVGVGMGKIYPGSWSEWIANPDHEVGRINQ